MLEREKEERKRRGDWAHLVESDLDVLEAEVIEGEHADIDQSEGEDLAGEVGVDLKGRDQREEGHTNKKEKKRRSII